MASLIKRANDMRKLCGAGFTVAEAHALLSDFYAGKDTLRIPPRLVKVAECFINDLPLDGSTKIEKQRRSLPSKLNEIREMYSSGFSAAGARRFVSELRNEKNDTLYLSLNDVPNDARFSETLIKKLNQEPHISRLMLEKGLLSKESFVGDFTENLSATFLSSLTLKDIPTSQYAKINLEHIRELSIIEGAKPFASLPLYPFLKTAQNIEKLSLAPERFHENDLPVLKKGLPPNLKDFSLYVGKTYGVPTADITSSLPDGLETLTLENLKFREEKDILGLTDTMRSIKMLNLKNCRFTEPKACAETIATLLENKPLERLTISGKETGLTDEHVNAVLDIVEKPSYMLKHIDLPDTELSDVTKQRIRKLENNRTGKSAPTAAKETPDVPKTPEEERLDALFFEASADGDINRVYDALAKENKTLSLEDYRLKNADGYRLIDALAYSKQLNKVFTPERWKSAKEMQSVFDLLPDIHKTQLDGKDGRPNFQTMKNQAMANAVRQRVSVSKNGGR